MTAHNNLPLYSVLMSVYAKEQPDFLMCSLSSMALQSYPPNEIILVCDGPLTVDLEKTISAFLIDWPQLLQLVRLPENRGLGEALNQGLHVCRNEYIVRMDSDDFSIPSRCAHQLTYMMQHDLDFCGTYVQEFDITLKNAQGRRLVPIRHSDIVSYAKRRNPFNHPSVAFKKSCVLNAGGYLAMPFFEDYYLWLRMLMSNFKAGNLSEILLYMRTSEDFYSRRGGIAYCLQSAHFWFFASQIGFLRWYEASWNIIVRCLVCLLPNGLRTTIYKHKLRKGASV